MPTRTRRVLWATIYDSVIFYRTRFCYGFRTFCVRHLHDIRLLSGSGCGSGARTRDLQRMRLVSCHLLHPVSIKCGRRNLYGGPADSKTGDSAAHDAGAGKAAGIGGHNKVAGEPHGICLLDLCAHWDTQIHLRR